MDTFESEYQKDSFSNSNKKISEKILFYKYLILGNLDSVLDNHKIGHRIGRKEKELNDLNEVFPKSPIRMLIFFRTNKHVI